MAMTLFGVPAYAEESLAEDTPRRLSEDIIVTAKIEGYNANEASSATRINTPLLETPQSVTVIPRQVIEDLQAVRVEDALDYAGGFVRGNNFGGMQLGSFTLRGFSTAEYFRNGFAANRGVTAMPDAITIERLDVLRGPAALLYGRGDPGGTFNIVTRQPEPKAAYDISARITTFGGWRGAASITGGLASDGALRYRISAAIEGGGTYRDHVDTERYVVAPVLAWDVGENTTITLDTEFLRSDTMLDRGIPNYPGQVTTRLPASLFVGEPSVKPWRTRSDVGQLRVDQRFGGDWVLSGGVQYYRVNIAGEAVEATGIRDGHFLRRNFTDRELDSRVFTGQANLAGTLQTGTVKHTVLLGAEYVRYKYHGVINRSRMPDSYELDILDPVYGAEPPPAFPNSDTKSDEESYAAYLQDQVSLTEWLKLLAGVRVERFKSQSQNLRTSTSSGFSQTVITPRFGVVVLPVPTLSIYGSYSKSNKPNSSFDRFGRVLDPERGVSYEVGAKADLLNGAFSLTGALFHIVKQNVANTDPDDVNFNIAAGEVRSRGFDVTLSGEPVKGWRITGGYSYADAEVTKDNRLPLGIGLSNAPRHSASALSVYEIQNGPLQGFGFGTGVVYVGSRPVATSATSVSLPGYTIVNLLAYYDLTDKIRLQANVNNLFDKRYDERASGSNFYPGAPLNGVFSISARF